MRLGEHYRIQNPVSLIFINAKLLEQPMINWPNMLHDDMEHWADGFLTGAAATLLIAIAGVAIALLARAM